MLLLSLSLSLSLAIAALPATGLGALYPAATLDRPVEQAQCRTSYGFVTADPIAKVAAFYRDEAARAGVALVAETPARFTDFKTLLFAHEPQLLSVVLDSAKGRTIARVFFHARIPAGCGDAARS